MGEHRLPLRTHGEKSTFPFGRSILFHLGRILVPMGKVYFSLSKSDYPIGKVGWARGMGLCHTFISELVDLPRLRLLRTWLCLLCYL